VYGDTFTYVDSAPFLVCLEKSATYDPKITMGLFEDVMKSAREFFLGQYGEMLGMRDMSGEVLVVWIWKDKRTYHEKTGAPGFAGGHYDHSTKNLYVYKGTDDIYATLFHEGTHMLVDFSRKGVPESGLFWFTEGVACYFQGWKRDAKGNIVHGMPAKDWYRCIKEGVRAEAPPQVKYEPLEKFMALDYATFMRQSSDPRANQVRGVIRYGQAWSLVWFFNNAEGGKYKSKWEDYLKREIAGKGGFEAVKDVFGDLNKLEEEWKAYVKALVLE
jgi:hypothetical protein